MVSQQVAFEAPEHFAGSCPQKSRPIDLAHLATQTMGDPLLEIEVLQLFARQARQLMKELSSGGVGAGVVVETAHRLKGAALAVGAFGVAETAGAAEVAPEDAGHLAALSAAVIEAELFILKLSR